MKTMMCTAVFVVLVAVWCQVCSVGALNLQSSPETFFPGITPNLTLRCTPGDTVGIMAIVVFQLSKDGVLLATGKPDAVVFSDSLRTTKFSATDQINLNNLGNSFLLFNIQFPEDEDEGKYVCHMIYQDNDSFFQNAEATFRLQQNATEDVDIHHQLKRLDTLVDNLMTRISTLETEAFDLKTVNANQSRTIANLISLFSNRIAFFATLKQQREINTDDVIVFDHVLFNNGSAFNATSGVFVAPRSGFYMLSLVCEVQSTIIIRMEMILKVDGKIIMKLFIAGEMASKGGQQSGSLVYRLAAGSEVKVIVGAIQMESAAQLRLLNENLSYFSGYFLG